MKKLLSIAVALCIGLGSFAQGFGSRMADVDLDFELGNSPFSVAPVSYIYFGFNGITNSNDATLNQIMGFFQSQHFGINIAELAVSPFEGGRVSLGADFSVNWFNINKDYLWCPSIYPVKPGRESWGNNGMFVSYLSKDRASIKEVKRSVLSVCTFEIPVTFSYSYGPFTAALGASLDINLNGCVQFKGIDTGGNKINEMFSGKRYSNRIGVNRLTFNVHAALSYGGLGLYFKYSPIPKFYQGVVGTDEEAEVVQCGPQFQIWSVGLVLGLGI